MGEGLKRAFKAARRTRKTWGAFHNDILCCTGIEREMKNKVENEKRIDKRPDAWQAKVIES